MDFTLRTKADNPHAQLDTTALLGDLCDISFFDDSYKAIAVSGLTKPFTVSCNVDDSTATYNPLYWGGDAWKSDGLEWKDKKLSSVHLTEFSVAAATTKPKASIKIMTNIIGFFLVGLLALLF